MRFFFIDSAQTRLLAILPNLYQAIEKQVFHSETKIKNKMSLQSNTNKVR